MKIEIGDLVKLRDDLRIDKNYGKNIYIGGMQFKGFKKVVNVDERGQIQIEGMTYSHLSAHYWYTKEMIAEVKRPTTIYKRKEILDKEEKEYLSAVIRPFRNDIEYIEKTKKFAMERIIIRVNNDYMDLPYFKPGVMYKGMKNDKEYTLEELGL